MREKAGRTKTTNTSTCFLISEKFVKPNRDSFCGRHTNAHCSIGHTHKLQGAGLRVNVLDKKKTKLYDNRCCWRVILEPQMSFRWIACITASSRLCVRSFWLMWCK